MVTVSRTLTAALPRLMTTSTATLSASRHAHLSPHDRGEAVVAVDSHAITAGTPELAPKTATRRLMTLCTPSSC
ncbi:uncharacterized protein LOC62_06G007789 [Vanrija pseudolonga]|uniref:Uncharacterized protein n=1 Tax=Vanrija pseudolonga TaxID=143232 RepID=A0AAF1BPM7_9TREE|nr:hypothetical protein LOC62_06G007789 [Vanrija pseudolonga]